MMRPTSSLRNAASAVAIARYVLPVPAGPMPKTTSWLAMVRRYSNCPAVFATTGSLRAEVWILMLDSERRFGAASCASKTERTAYKNSCRWMGHAVLPRLV